MEYFRILKDRYNISFNRQYAKPQRKQPFKLQYFLALKILVCEDCIRKISVLIT